MLYPGGYSIGPLWRKSCTVTTSFTPLFYSALSNKFNKKKTIQSHGNQMEFRGMVCQQCQMLETDENE